MTKTLEHLLKQEVKTKVKNGIYCMNPFTDAEDYWDEKEHFTSLDEAILAELLPKKKYDTALDIGAGIGRCTAPLAKICKHIIAHEPSFKALEWMKKNRKISNIEYLADKSETLPFKDDSFDLINCVTVIEHIKHDDKLLSEAYRMLKPGGHFLLRNDAWFHNVLEKIGFFGRKVDPTHINMMTGAALEKKVIKAGFKIVSKQMFPFYRWLGKYDKYLPLSNVFCTKANFILTK